MCGMDSCCDYDAGYEKSEQDTMAVYGDRAFLVFHVTPVDTRGMTIGNVTERIKTLRIIVLNDTEEHTTSIEYNKLITLRENGFMATSFSYDIMLPTVPGKKKVYFIANEKSVGNITINGNSSSTTLSAWLNQFLPESEGNGSDNTASVHDAEEFETNINSIYFTPAYTVQNGDIFLPYTSYYYDGLLTVKGQTKEITAYLVPVATKFFFKFVNNRDAAVEVQGITLSKAHKDNYLFAQVSENELKKKLPEDEDASEGRYWIDWLAIVSKRSHEAPDYSDNIEFNGEYGWISDFEMPTEYASDVTVIDKNDDTEKLQVAAADGNGAGKLILGPYYVPESRNLVTYEDGQNNSITEQIYYLTLNLHDTGSGKAPEFDNQPIGNLHSLFRNTCVLIKLTMNQGNVEIYAEINPWTTKEVKGWVVGGPAPN